MARAAALLPIFRNNQPKIGVNLARIEQRAVVAIVAPDPLGHLLLHGGGNGRLVTADGQQVGDRPVDGLVVDDQEKQSRR